MITPDVLLLAGMLITYGLGAIFLSDSKDGSPQRATGVFLTMLSVGLAMALGYYLGAH